MKISLITVCYNAEKTIADAMASVASQQGSGIGDQGSARLRHVRRFELLCRFIWKNKARMKYLPICTTVMRMGGASTDGWRTTLKINRFDLRALKANGCWSCLPFLYSRYLVKIWGFVFKR